MRSLIATALVLACVSVAAAQPRSTEFPAPHNSQQLLSPLLDPQQALQRIHVPDGFEVTLAAAEPDVQQPIGMAFDARGRLWIAENYTYAEQQVNHDLSLRDRIIILEDIDQDGRFDKRTVFWDQAQRLTSIEIGFGGVWALCAPHLLFLPDADGDDVPDSEPQVVLDGWSADASRHNFVNGLRWGPDGWLYGRHGIMDTSLVGAPGTPRGSRVEINCGIWRYHPTRRTFQVVCHGTTNPWGADWDEHGQLFFINTVIGHLWHVIPGAHYQRMYGEDFNPHLYQLIDQTADHFHWDTAEAWSDLKKTGLTETSDRAGGGHAHCGMMIYLGDNWPAEYRGDVFTLNLHGRRVNRDVLERHGATYVGRHAPDLLASGDEWFRGIELAAGPDGGVYILDWSDLGECHENDGVHRTSGRIFKVTYGQPRPAAVGDLEQLSSQQLVELQLHENEWYVRQARRLLQERAAAGAGLDEVRAQLLQIYEQDADHRHVLRALWCLYLIGATDDEWLVRQLDHPSEHVRVWAVQVLVDGDRRTDRVALALAQLAGRENSGLVLTFLASALQKLQPQQGFELAQNLLQHGALADDPVWPLMLWYGVERLAAAAPETAVELAVSSEVPRVTQFLARRLTYQLESRPAAVERLVRSLQTRADLPFRSAVLQGMAEALRGWRKAEAPPSWTATTTLLNRAPQPEVRALVRELSVVFGDGRAIDELKGLVTSSRYDPESRRRAIQTLVDTRAAGTDQLLTDLLTDRELGPSAVRGLAALGGDRLPEMLLERYPQMHLSIQASVVETLCARVPYAARLLDAIERGEIDRDAVPTFLLRQMQLLGGPQLNQRIADLWPGLRLITADKLERIAEYRQRLTPDRLSAADLQNGRALYDQSCGKCHKLFGEGGEIGPELTGAQRGNLNYLLENIVDPSASLAVNYRMSILLLDDGRLINGVIGQQTERTIAVQTPTEQLILDRGAISGIRPSELSLMPDGLLDLMQEDHVRDLLAYLMSPEQVPRAEEER